MLAVLLCRPPGLRQHLSHALLLLLFLRDCDEYFRLARGAVQHICSAGVAAAVLLACRLHPQTGHQHALQPLLGHRQPEVSLGVRTVQRRNGIAWGTRRTPAYGDCPADLAASK